MLDNLGFVAETNACNIFMAKNNILYTPWADACLPGITRSLIIKLAKQLNIEIIERNISLVEFYNADEVFTTGTMGELTPVHEIDGRLIENKTASILMNNLYTAFKKMTDSYGEPIN